MSSAGVLTCMPDSGQIFRETSLRPPVPGQETKHFKTEKYTMEPQQPRYKEDVLREAEGCVSHDTRFSRWGRSLNGLLDDQDGATLFRMYLEGEGLVDLLSFWFACNGFRAMDLAEPKTLKTAKAIYRWYVQNSQAVSSRLKPATRAQVKDCVKNQQLNRTLFDQAQQEIQKAMEQEAFPSFLQSDICKEYSHVEDSPTPDSPRLGLPTLTEDEEFGVHHGPVNTGAVGKINRAFTRIPPRHQRFHTRKAEAAYQYFAPAASINDSEISSDALTEDSMSMTDGSVDGIPPYRSKKQREIHRSVSANGQVHLPFVPRTLRPPAEMMPSNPAEFAAKLTIALERVKKQREAEERLEERLQRLKEEEEKVEYDIPSSGHEPFATSAEDDPQSILDDHVSRVLKTPANLSPRAQSPFTQRKAKGQSAFAKCQSSTSSHIRPKVSQGMESVVPASVEHKSANSSQGTRSYRKTEGCAQSYRVEEGSSSVPLTTPLSPEQEVERTHSVLQWVLESAKLMKKHHRDGSTTVNHCPEMKKSTHRTASQPAHLFLQDTSMPPLTAPNTLDQLEEARRRLVEEKRLPKVHKARCAPSSTLKEKGKTTESVPSSGFSTLKLSEEHKSAKKLNSDGQGQGGLAIVYYFCGERIPYMIRTKEPSLTLQEFKELLSKKGSYKYYFKKESHEFECNAVFQEVSEEDAVLPLYEEKIICKVERAC